VSFNACGHDILNEDEVLPVLLRCSTCGASALIGEHDYAVSLDELNDWAREHECPRGLSVT
jgi:hypothetical protein